MTELSVCEFGDRAEEWLRAHAHERAPNCQMEWGVGPDTVAVFHNLSATEERARVDALRDWQRLKSDAGYGSISWPAQYGGAGLAKTYEDEFRRRERLFVTPAPHEAVTISLNIEAPTILVLGTDEQKDRYLASLRRADLMCCQMFSEPSAGSDLGSIDTHAHRDGDDWVLNGQKVWTSGAQFADIGYLIARTDPCAPRQERFTAFIVPMHSPGLEVRPLRQMSGGSSFNEVFLTEVRLSDGDRVGAIGAGWAAMMTTLGFERNAGTGGGRGTDYIGRLIMLARHLGRDRDPIVRQLLVDAYCKTWVKGLNRRRAAERESGTPGPESSLAKLSYTMLLQQYAELASLLLGPRLTADSGEWGTFAWSELVTGTPGMRVAGGTDEIQRNTIAERVLGLPREPLLGR